MAAAVAPSTSLRFNPYKAVRFISFYTRTTNHQQFPTPSKALIKTLHFPPNLQRRRPFPFTGAGSTATTPLHRRRSFCTVIAGALSSNEAVEKAAKAESFETPRVGTGEKVKEFKKRMRIDDIKGGLEEGLDKLGQTLVVKGWVRTIRFQASITFIEVNDGSCLSNMQCVVNSDAEGYDQVESGLITTGASICVEGIIVSSQGSKQKVEMKATEIVLVGKSDPSFPIQKKRVSREFLRTKAHLRPRTNTFGAVMLSFLIGAARNYVTL